jgi:chromosome segregation ATPase
MLKRLLAHLRVVRAVRYEKTAADLTTWQERANKLSLELDRARSQHEASRLKISELGITLKQAQRNHKEAAAQLEKLRRHISRRAERDHKRGLLIQQLQQKLATAEQILAAARESLMVIEVKLDVLEGAANILDQRTRTVLADREETTTNV